MIVRRCFAPTAVFIVLTLLGEFEGSAAERWSRQVSNSEWIPLANPGTASAQLSRGNAENVLLSSSTHLPNPIQTLALPPALQQQYQDQLIQLQKTQESIQKLLLLQQQLKAQQQLLQTQTLLPGDYSSAEDEKQELPPSSLGNLQTSPELASEALVPPRPSTGALPPVHGPQNFLSQRPGQAYQNQELASLPVQEKILLQHGGNVEDTQEIPHTYIMKQGSQRPDGKRLKGQPRLPQSSLNGNAGDEEEEVQLVYVPAETLAQRGQLKRGRGRKQYPVRQQHQHRENQGNIDQTSLSPEQETFARQVLQQIQKEHEEKEQFLKEERMREFTRLNEEQKALERKARLQQEAFQREQELLRQKEAEKKRKELERLEEMARQQELDRIREAREKQRQEELERRRLSELRIKEDRRREEEARQREERQKLELEQQRILEGQQDDQLRPTSPNFQNSQSLIREQARRQHLPDGTRIKKIRGRQRPRVNQYQEQSTYHEVTTTPSPNQPPLSVYMGSSSSRLDTVKVTDVLKILKNAKTIAVLDNVNPNSPQVFVGPSNLDPPYGYAKFDLPYLSSIDHNRVERKVDKLPFFVAPLSFDPPPGYSKIPFPAPHIGSVVINNLSETSSESNTPTDEQSNPSPTPLIEPNSYSDVDQSGSIATTASYDSSSTQGFSPESNSPKYEPAYLTPPSNSKFRFRQYYDNKPSPVISTTYYGEQSTAKTKPKHYYEQEKLTTQPPRLETTVSYRQEVTYSSTPNFQDRSVSPHDPSTKEQDLVAQLALINQELVQQREPQKYTAEQYHSQSNLGESYDANDVRAPVGPTQYNLPAELPPISPHLPGLINSLLDKQEENPPVAPTPPPTTTTTTTTTPATTTTRISSTTYRPRGRGRTVPTRPRTTQAPTNRTERTRRPAYNRSKSRFTTTTEEYRESTYEPTKAKTPETTQKYNAVEHRRPASRTQKYRNRDRASSQVQNHNVQANYENYPQSESQSNTSPDAYSPPSGSASGLYQKETPPSGMSNYPENYPITTQTENYPPTLREIQHSTPLVSEDYSRRENYPQNRPQETRYQQDVTYVQNDGFQPSGLEKTPVNGFNYQVVNENSPDQTIPQRTKEYPRYQEDYNLGTTVEPRVTPGEEHRYSPIYEAQTQPDYNTGGQNAFRNIDDGKIESTAIETDSNASPVFVSLQQSKQEDYELPSTESLITEMTTTSTTTPASVIIRQRVRARLGGRTHHDSAIQTRPRGSQDEYVRFSAVNNDAGRGGAATGQRHRDGLRTRTRARPQSHGSQVQTEGNEYIKIHAVQQRLVATTERPTTTSTTARTVEEDVDYGFIRPPNFRPLHPVHPVDTRFQAPVTYRPALSEIQHILSNDETEVESSPTHVSKNRPKYQTSNRRPTTKIFTTTTSTTTETVPVATTMPDDAVYTVKPKTRTDESRSTRVRGRVRRPGKKRITTTTESGLEANNELPLDENYPRITPQQLPVTASGQQPLYDDNFDVTPQFVPNQNRPTQFYEESSENYPPQEFVLNFDNLPEQVSQREEYDQTQLASVLPKKYSHSSRVNPDASAHPTGDIYGAESQWSTKLSKTSFQPSFASNRVPGETKRGRDETGNDQENENAPEIITAGPEVSSVTMIVSSDYQKHSNDADNADTMMDSFGWKTNAQDHMEKLNATTAVTNSPTTVPQNQVQSDKETLPKSRTSSNNENFKEQMGDGARVTKPDSPTGRKTRRRKVRVRVRPLMDDFVTAESQHYNSAVNSLVQDQYKYNPIRESRFTTAQPIATTVTASTAAAAESTKKSLLQNFLEEMLKNDEISIPTRVTSVTTELSDWTTPMTTPMTTPSVFSNDGEVTTMKENYIPNDTTMNINEERIPAVNEDSNGSKDESQKAKSFEGTTRLSQERTEVQKESKPEEDWNKKSSQEDKSEPSDLEDVEVFNLPSNYPDESGTSKKDENNITKLSAIGKEKEHVMTLKRQENIEENEAHPKNHKTKWSEVKYPLTFEKSQNALNTYSTTLIPGVVTRDEGDGSVKTLSDYVKAIFDSMKNAEEGEEIAKVVEAKSETDNYNLNNTASAHAARTKESEEIDRKADTTGSPQDSSATQRVEENGTKHDDTQEVTTKESTTTFGATTLIPDATASTAVPSENTLVTEPSTTTAKTSIRQAGNIFRTNSTMLGKVLKTSTTTKVSHMTEICYRGRCVMTKPKMEDIMMR